MMEDKNNKEEKNTNKEENQITKYATIDYENTNGKEEKRPSGPIGIGLMLETDHIDFMIITGEQKIVDEYFEINKDLIQKLTAEEANKLARELIVGNPIGVELDLYGGSREGEGTIIDFDCTVNEDGFMKGIITDQDELVDEVFVNDVENFYLVSCKKINEKKVKLNKDFTLLLMILKINVSDIEKPDLVSTFRFKKKEEITYRCIKVLDSDDVNFYNILVYKAN